MTLVTCSHCCGTGKTELTGIYAETLELLRQQKRAVTGAGMARLAKVKNEAMCNRLKALEGHGLVVGYRYGSRVLWRAVGADRILKGEL